MQLFCADLYRLITERESDCVSVRGSRAVSESSSLCMCMVVWGL